MALLRILLGVALALYPVAVYFGLKSGAHSWLGVGLIGLGLFRFWSGAKKRTRPATETIMAIVLVGFGIATLVVGTGDLLLYYPVVMSYGVFSIFAVSLIFPPTLVERLARIREPELPPKAVRYCRRVTLVWCVFLAGNGAVAAWTVAQNDPQLWLFYNGLLSYVLMGALFLGEWLVRSWLRGTRQGA